MVGASAPLHPLSVWQSQVMPCSGNRVGEVAPVVEALEVVVVVVMVKGQPACTQWEVSCTVKDEGKKKGSNLSEVFFVGAPGMVRATGKEKKKKTCHSEHR